MKKKLKKNVLATKNFQNKIYPLHVTNNVVNKLIDKFRIITKVLESP